MKNSKKIFIVAMSMIMIIATIIPMYAIDNNRYEFNTIPDDIGVTIDDYTNITQNKIVKLYLVITITGNVTTTGQRLNCSYSYHNNGGTLLNNNVQYIILNYDSFYRKIFNMESYSSYYSFLFIPQFYINQDTTVTLYVPIYIRNINNINFEMLNNDNIQMSYTLHYSTSDENTIATEAFQLGYNNGYTNGYADGLVDGAEIVQDLNLVEHCEQLLGTFVGDDYAHYITPLCLALVVILVYFLFIRWLLALVKSKNVTRVADIVVCTACIIMLVIMYAPMLDLTIHQAQTVYQITADTVVGG